MILELIKHNICLISFELYIKHILKYYGTSLPCNRFNIGNIIEYAFGDMLKKCNPELNINNYDNSKRIDIEINNKFYSIKYSKSGHIKLHNSNNKFNTDYDIHNLIIITPKKLYIIDKNENMNLFKINTGDGLALSRKYLNNNFDNIKSLDIDIEVNKNECKNNSVSLQIYKESTRQFFRDNDFLPPLN